MIIYLKELMLFLSFSMFCHHYKLLNSKLNKTLINFKLSYIYILIVTSTFWQIFCSTYFFSIILKVSFVLNIYFLKTNFLWEHWFNSKYFCLNNKKETNLFPLFYWFSLYWKFLIMKLHVNTWKSLKALLLIDYLILWILYIFTIRK